MKRLLMVSLMVMMISFVPVAQAAADDVICDSCADSDRDGVNNCQDKCPGTIRDCAVDAEGCLLDSDKDGVIDCKDTCPDTPAGCKVDSYYGCPYDSDKDSVIDCRDRCPDTPHGCAVDHDGCPVDLDHDGVIDCQDKCICCETQGCPVDPEGCPVDSDKDGVFDCRDKCPGTPAGFKVDKDGCMRAKATVELMVQFDTDKSFVKDEYRDDIRKVADFMKEYPNTKAVIEGHTDSVASDAYNLRLSNDRSNSVRQYLIKEFGVEPSRLTSRGYGESRPIATNDTDEGRQKNRRVWAVIEEIEIK
ncbi:MAG TPA: OmpA family protein [Smithella sp.]|nr:OmpA family protein [Smithella sp.]HOG82062.1 OmpA family protein [Smithellaceae bacterium]